MNILDTIIEHKREHIASQRRRVPLAALQSMPSFERTPYSLAKALHSSSPAIIAEIKQASPSRHIIRAACDPVSIAREYASSGAQAISVVTDEEFFMGRLDFIRHIRPEVTIPILRKDFIIDPYQLYEAKAYGADAVLLIAAVLNPEQLSDFAREAATLGLESLVEVHTEEDLECLHMTDAGIVGINNRDLASFETHLNTSVRLRPLVPQGITVVSESGISTRHDIEMLMGHGISAFLVGEALMRAEHPGKALTDLLLPTNVRA